MTEFFPQVGSLCAAGAPERPAAPAWRPRSPGQEERLRWRCDATVADGRSFRLQLPPERTAAVLEIRPFKGADSAHQTEPPVPAARWTLGGPCGSLWLEEGAGWVHALTGVAIDAHGDDPVLAEWLLEAASAALHRSGLPGFDQLASSVPTGPLRRYSLILRTDDHSCRANAWADDRTVIAWTALASPAVPTHASLSWRDVAVDWQVVVARHRLPAFVLRQLARGSLIKAHESFSTEGRGLWAVGPRTWQTRCDGDRLFLEQLVDQDPGLAAPAPFPTAETSVSQPDAAAVDELPIELRFELGSVRMTFGEAGRLQPGSELPLSRVAGPCEVAIKVGNSQIGLGELVEVEGSLVVRVVSLHAPKH
jgi:flagellar motor switch/type III secretory pathway protein FliN